VTQRRRKSMSFRRKCNLNLFHSVSAFHPLNLPDLHYPHLRKRFATAIAMHTTVPTSGFLRSPIPLRPSRFLPPSIGCGIKMTLPFRGESSCSILSHQTVPSARFSRTKRTSETIKCASTCTPKKNLGVQVLLRGTLGGPRRLKGKSRGRVLEWKGAFGSLSGRWKTGARGDP
jgi:hypothetical protein